MNAHTHTHDDDDDDTIKRNIYGRIWWAGEIKNNGCVSRGPGFYFQHPQGTSQPSITQDPGQLRLFSTDPHECQAHM